MILPESVGCYESAKDHAVYREAGSLDNFSIHFILSGSGFFRNRREAIHLT